MSEYKPKELRLSKIPEDVYKALLKIQADAKLKCRCQKSLETVIFNLIRKEGKNGGS